jgi:predicted naringenin-chalcone synthase
MPSHPPPAYLHDFRVHLPAYRGAHADVVSWLAAAHARAEATLRKDDPGFSAEAFHRQMERHLRRFAPSPDVLGFRYSDIGEFMDTDFAAKALFAVDRDPSGAATGARMDAFSRMADRAVTALYAREAPGNAAAPEAAPDDLLHVTCTGYAAPSAAQRLVEARDWHAATRITHVYHMGCYASLPAVRIAQGYLASAAQAGRSARADVVHTEICSLHLNPARHDPEQLVVQSLFSDGFIRYSLATGDKPADGYEVLGFLERIVPGSLADIEWSPGDHGMRMTLSRDVPDKVAPHLDGFVTALAAECGLSRGQLDGAAYAVHPGGPRIVDKVEEWLRLAPPRSRASREVLFERGNMSSATLPHIWERLLRDEAAPPGAFVVSLAFGPGLTLYGSVMRRL